MKIAVIAVGKIAYAPFQEAAKRYAARIPYYVPFELKEIPDLRNTKSLTSDQQKSQEGANILKSLAPTDFVVLMDERGKELTSTQLSEWINDKMINLPARLVFVIGGPYGFSEDVYSRANAKLSLSKMTLPHELARVMLLEQIYRAMTIIKGEPYHHD